jgi:hypothetical protein
MADCEVKCITKPNPLSAHEHITHIGNPLRQPALEMASRASDCQHRRACELLLRGRSEVWQTLGCRRYQISRPCAIPSDLCRR